MCFFLNKINIQNIKSQSGPTYIEDRDNSDYIYSINDLSELKGHSMHKIKNFTNRFKALYPEVETRILDLTNDKIQTEILNLFDEWKKTKNDTEHERIAITRTIKDADKLSDLYSLGLYDKSRLIAFMMFDLANQDYAQSHFAKALSLDYKGIFPYLFHTTANFLLEKQNKNKNRKRKQYFFVRKKSCHFHIEIA